MKTSLGDRMKEAYESIYKFRITGRMPVIIRLDVKAGHSLFRGCQKPFDENIIRAMNTVAKYLCKEIQGAVMAYVQSDEISILINNFKTLEQTPWFANEVQKIASVSAGMASAVLTKELGKIAVFDSRVFPIPKEEVVNLLIWRQQDWERNSIQMLAQSLYSHKQLHGKNKADLNEMCFQKGHNWNDLPVYLKRGRCVVYTDSGWEVDNDIPIFKDNRRYIEELLKTEEGETR